MAILLNILLQVDRMMDGWGIWMIIMVIFWLLIVILIITMIWFLVRRAGNLGQDSSQESALDILRKRYARGEIDEEQYRRMKEELADRNH